MPADVTACERDPRASEANYKPRPTGGHTPRPSGQKPHPLLDQRPRQRRGQCSHLRNNAIGLCYSDLAFS